MQSVTQEMDFDRILAEERPRLIRLCMWFTGSREAAQDLAQETLMAAWHNQDQLVSLEKLKPWTSAIARNICLNWSRRQYQEQAHLAYSVDSEDSAEDTLEAETSLEIELDRYELAKLLDQALSLLPRDTAQMLVEHYIRESSHAEIAEKMNIQPGTVAVRLQRGKLALKRLLRTNLHAQASAFGLINPESNEWEETNIWCLSCGNTRLLGKYQKGETFALRCPVCDPDPESIMAGLDLTKPYHARLLGNTRMYKPAYTRLVTALAPLYHQALQSLTAPCLACGKPVGVSVERARRMHQQSQEFIQITLRCPSCDWASNKASSSLVMALPEVQRFWRESPRMQILPPQEIEIHGSPAFLTELRSVSSAAALSVLSRQDTFQLIEVHSNIKL